MPSVSENKVRVTRLFGGSSVMGVMDPSVNMFVNHGAEAFWIKAVAADNSIVDLALASGGAVVRQAYPMDIYIDEPVASGYGWPSGGGSYVWGTSEGVAARDTTKMTFLQAGSPYSFAR